MTSRHIPLAVPELGGNERQYIDECLATGYVSSVGPFVERFEREFAEYVGAKYAIACVNGTAALHVALRLAGSAPRGYVAVPTFTFIASVNAVSYTGAQPWLIDSEADTWNADGEALYDEVVRRAKSGAPLPEVIEVVHVLGHPAQLEPLLALRAAYGIPIVEDAAEALGATWISGGLKGRHVGTVGDLGCFSFNGNKIITTGGGGMIVTNDASLAEQARHLTTQAKLPGRGYQHDQIGYNYRLTNLAAAVGVAQLEQLPEFLSRKRKIAADYNAALNGLPVETPPAASWAASSHWLYSVLLEPGTELGRVLERLEMRGVQARALWPPLHLQQPYRDSPRLGGSVAERVFSRGISLPCSVGLTAEAQARVVDALVEALDV